MSLGYVVVHLASGESHGASVTDIDIHNGNIDFRTQSFFGHDHPGKWEVVRQQLYGHDGELVYTWTNPTSFELGPTASISFVLTLCPQNMTNVQSARIGLEEIAASLESRQRGRTDEGVM